MTSHQFVEFGGSSAIVAFLNSLSPVPWNVNTALLTASGLFGPWYVRIHELPCEWLSLSLPGGANNKVKLCSTVGVSLTNPV